MTKEQAKQEIQKLINRYELKKSQHLLTKYNEAMTRKDFILPLFKALGWDVHNEFGQEFIEEEKAIEGRIDYVCQIDNTPKLYLEIKAIKVDLEKEQWAKQVISYAYHKGISWAILSDFEGIKVFNAEWEVVTPEQCKFFELSADEYLEKFEKLWLLSREACTQNLLDEKALEWGKKPKRVSINELLANDLVKWHDKLKIAFESKNTISEQIIEESIQRFLDRLVFIRTIEDRNIEQKYLWQSLQEWIAKDRKPGLLIDKIHELFNKYNIWYNSKLFKKHSCDSLNFELAESYFESIIDDLYREKGISKIPYTFDKIDADTLGNIYEQYLGSIQKGETRDEKRKQHGIYYTRNEIVKYILDCTLGSFLKNHSLQEIENIKILDPACGSGSFLIKALEILNNHLRQAKNENNAEKTFHYIRKSRILNENIFGVDLDPRATEIARLNLLLKNVDSRGLLPELVNNIQEGNSLVSGNKTDLEKYFGKFWEKQKPFNWNEKFSEIPKCSFDIVVGNPPYIDSEELSRTQPEFRNYCVNHFECAKGNWDIYCLFIEKGLELLKDNGYFGMIIPNKILSANYAESIRKIINKYKIIAIRDYSNIKVFNAGVYPVVIIVQKKQNKNNKFIYELMVDLNTVSNIVNIKQNDLKDSGWTQSLSNILSTKYGKKMKKSSVRLDQVADVEPGATVSEAYTIKKIIKNIGNEKDYYKFINSGCINPFDSLWDTKRIYYIKNSYLKPIIVKEDLKKIALKRYNDSGQKKIIVANMTRTLEAFYDDKAEYLAGKSTNIIKYKNIDLNVLLAIINSKMMTHIYKTKFRDLSMQGGALNVGTNQLRDLPIIIPNREETEFLKTKSQNLNNMYKTLKDEYEESDKWNKIMQQIVEIKDQIDQKVYELYGLSKKEIEIIEKV